MNVKAAVQLVRPKHYLKNVLIFLPLIFSGLLFKEDYFLRSIYSFIAFSMVASAVYIINDIKDKDLDARHPKKKYRPIASGAINAPAAVVLAIVLLAIALCFQYLANFAISSFGLLGLYVLINIAYSFGLKNIPIVDVAILSVGFVLRVFYGGVSLNIEVSKWLYLAVLAFSFYLGLGKRRNEIRINGNDTRKVNKHYTQAFLDKNMYVCLGLTIAYYSLWAIDPLQPHKRMFLTIPLLIVVVMAYSLAIEETDSDGDPVSVVLGNQALLVLVVLYGLLMTALVYF